jgi:molybdenum cofactor synthesis domain-containing protein
MVMEARTLADQLKTNAVCGQDQDQDRQLEQQQLVQSLDALGYDEAAQYVYGMNYDDWKKRHAKKANDDQMTRYNNSEPLWAIHDKNQLSKRSEFPAEKSRGSDSPPITTAVNQAMSINSESMPLASNVCCQDVDAEPLPKPVLLEVAPVETPKTTATTTTRDLKPYQPPPPPSKGMEFSIGILTVSDRAASGSYETGDLSGPAIEQAVTSFLQSLSNTTTTQASSSVYTTSKIEMAIVPDNVSDIQAAIRKWTDVETTKRDRTGESFASTPPMDLILTTGGTGFAPRDVTPEATASLLDRPCPGLVAFCTAECSKLQPLASLSRGTAGVRGTSLIVNLPGNPHGVQELIPVLLPLALHAIQALQQSA